MSSCGAFQMLHRHCVASLMMLIVEPSRQEWKQSAITSKDTSDAAKAQKLRESPDHVPDPLAIGTWLVKGFGDAVVEDEANTVLEEEYEWEKVEGR